MTAPVPASLTSQILLSIRCDVLVILNFVFQIAVQRFLSFGTEGSVEMQSCECMLKLSVRKPSFLGFYVVICATALRPISLIPFQLLVPQSILSLVIEDMRPTPLTHQFSHCSLLHSIHLRGH